jgi:hypothetical protein
MLALTSTLAAELRRACCREVHRAMRPLRAINPDEPVLVAALNESTVDYATAWRKILSRDYPQLTLSAAAVFTHQTPRVTYAGSQTCELADQLIAIVDRRNQTKDVPAIGRAMLMQVKKAEKGAAAIRTTGDLKQLQLLSERPLFSVTRPANGPKDVDIKQLRPDSALFYALVGRGFPYWCDNRCHPYLQWMVRDNLSEFANTAANAVNVKSSENFAAVVVGMLQGMYGWEFKLPPLGNDWRYFSNTGEHWSELISYLLTETFKKKYSQRIIRIIKADKENRGNESPLFFMGGGTQRLAVTGHVSSLSVLSNDEISDQQVEWSQYTRRDSDGDDIPPREGSEFGEYSPGPISAIVIEIGSNDE